MKEFPINNYFEYTDLIPEIENILNLVKYLDDTYKQFLKLYEEDEKKNEKYITSAQVWEYKKRFFNGIDIFISDKNFHSIKYSSFETLNNANMNQPIKDIRGLSIKLSVSYENGEGNNLTEHEHSFDISFKPYLVEFVRKSTDNNESMNQIEDNINSLLNQFNKADCIFSK